MIDLDLVSAEVYMPSLIANMAPGDGEEEDARLSRMIGSYCFARDNALSDYYVNGSFDSLRVLGDTERVLPGNVRLSLTLLGEVELLYVLRKVARWVQEVEGDSFREMKKDPIAYALREIREHEKEFRHYVLFEGYTSGDIGTWPN